MYLNKIEALSTEVQSKLARLCPHLTERDAHCCSSKQLDNMEKSFQIISAFVGRCPSCLYNFRKVFCDMSCSPIQDTFLKATKTEAATHETKGEVELVTELEYKINEQFVNKVYDSCKNVVNPSTSTKVLSLVCGAWGADLCSPTRLLDFVGDIRNGNTPFQINFKYSNESEAFNPDSFACHEVPPGSNSSCSCSDCEAACVPPDFGVPTPEEQKEILKERQIISGSVLVVIFVVLTVLFLLLVRKLDKTKVYPINKEENGLKIEENSDELYVYSRDRLKTPT